MFSYNSTNGHLFGRLPAPPSSRRGLAGRPSPTHSKYGRLGRQRENSAARCSWWRSLERPEASEAAAAEARLRLPEEL